jgi:2-alkyl-3-oxoalkanoate reductase
VKVFVTGSTGAIGRLLIPALIRQGHGVVALVRTSEKAKQIDAQGAEAVVADALDEAQLTSAVVHAKPDVIIHQLTSLAKAGNLRKFDQEFELTNRMRTEVTATLLGAARAVGVRRFIAQSFCGWPFARVGSAIKDEADALDDNPPANFRKSLKAIQYLESAVERTTNLHAVALRYGFLYGPGSAISRDGSIVNAVLSRKLPIVGSGTGVWSFIHIADAVQATIAAVIQGDPGIYNVVDDDPAPVAEWLPALAATLGAKAPFRIPLWLGRIAIGEGGVSMMTRVRGGSNKKAKCQLRWQPEHCSWRQGFVSGLDK